METNLERTFNIWRLQFQLSKYCEGFALYCLHSILQTWTWVCWSIWENDIGFQRLAFLLGTLDINSSCWLLILKRSRVFSSSILNVFCLQMIQKAFMGLSRSVHGTVNSLKRSWFSFSFNVLFPFTAVGNNRGVRLICARRELSDLGAYLFSQI